MKNKTLQQFYNRVYRRGERRHYTPLILSGDKIPPAREAVLKEISWKGKRVLDAGCGTGELSYLIAERGAKEVKGVDYAKEAIRAAEAAYRRPNLTYLCGDLGGIKGGFDVIVSLGTLEHLDNPLAALRRFKKMLVRGGSLILTCPNWANPRGYMLLTLYHLFGARITLADLHYFTPLEFEEWSKVLKMKLSWKTVDQDWAHGEKLVRDFKRRLPNVARDSNLPTDKARIAGFLRWVEKHVPYFEKESPHGGAVALYHFKK